ncbi:MAG TPA: TlpA family protein disulfide reductase [Chromatiales bacterium]|nr:TlpA family protein disulfide reductase [Chromatiales bacterium]
MLSLRRHSLLLLLALGPLLPGTPLAATEPVSRELSLPSGEDIGFEVYGVGNPLRVLWIGPNFGLQPRHRQVAAALGQRGLEVWQVDLPEARFQPTNTHTLRRIPGEMVADIIHALAERGRHPVLVISSIYGAIPALRGIHAWQGGDPEPGVLIGAIFFSPYFYTHVPALGEDPTFVPELYATNVPVYIFQAAKNGNRWQLPATLAVLQRHAPVYTEILDGVTSLFYAGDTAPETRALLPRIPDRIIRAARILQRHEAPLTALPLPAPSSGPATPARLDSRLKPYRGRVQPRPFALRDAAGRPFRRDSFTGRITLVNFWASWCPPCVEEIPSLNRLKQKMRGRPFELISINYAESPAHIRDFMQKVAVDFPVLVDPDGRLTARWQVVAFPSTFVIGPDGTIRYGVNAAIEWDTPEVIRQLEQLWVEE